MTEAFRESWKKDRKDTHSRTEMERKRDTETERKRRKSDGDQTFSIHDISHKPIITLRYILFIYSYLTLNLRRLTKPIGVNVFHASGLHKGF